MSRKKKEPAKSPEPSEQHHSSPVYTYLRIASTFGITLAMNIYLLSHLLGGWLDGRFGTNVLFRLILLFVALISAFMYLWKRVIVSERIEKEQREADAKADAEKKSLEERMEELRRDLDR
ncbi:MAG: AtpZ/AtpI family protein [Bacillota bacterium]|jgi:type VI protein secretion system component VasK